jgi:hypothetical protein
MVLGAVVAAAIGAGATPSIAASVTARSGETVAREAPDGGQAGIAVIRGSDRVRLIAERDDWSEIELPDGRRAWVPTAEVTRIEEPPRARATTVATPVPTAAETPREPATEPVPPPPNELGAEIDRLRMIVDAMERRRAEDPPSRAIAMDDRMLVLAGAALLVGIILGSAWERRRSRRDRSLKF